MKKINKGRFLERIKVFGECWEWQGTVAANGYGRCSMDNRNDMAHRVSYKLFVGPIADGMTIDHLCRNKRCVNPSHLEVVTSRENTLRGDTIAAENAAKSCCHKGHPLYGENLYMSRRGSRVCRECQKQHLKRSRSTDAYRLKHAEYERKRRAEAKMPRTSENECCELSSC